MSTNKKIKYFITLNGGSVGALYTGVINSSPSPLYLKHSALTYLPWLVPHLGPTLYNQDFKLVTHLMI